MNRISTLLDPYENVKLNLDVISRKRVFEEAASILSNASGIDKTAIFDGFIAREKLGSTAIAPGVAIPHARIAGVKAPCITLLRTTTPVDFSDSDQNQVQLFLAMLIPTEATDEYLPLLSQIASFFSDPTHIAALKSTDTPLNACRIVENWTPT